MKLHYLMCMVLWSSYVFGMTTGNASTSLTTPLSDELTQKIKVVYRVYGIDASEIQFFVHNSPEMASPNMSADEKGILLSSFNDHPKAIYLSPLMEFFLQKTTISESPLRVTINCIALFNFLHHYERRCLSISPNNNTLLKKQASINTIQRMPLETLKVFQNSAKKCFLPDIGFESIEEFVQFVQDEFIKKAAALIDQVKV